jgi:aminopeptidase C
MSLAQSIRNFFSNLKPVKLTSYQPITTEDDEEMRNDYPGNVEGSEEFNKMNDKEIQEDELQKPVVEQPKTPVFIGCNDKDMTDRIIALVDHPPFEVAILGTQKYINLVAEYQYQKLSTEQQNTIQDRLKSEEADKKCKDLALEMYNIELKDRERPYELFDKAALKEFFRIHRHRDITNKETDAVLQLMVALKYVVVINPDDKPHQFRYQLTIDLEKHIEALELKVSAIKNEIKLFQGEVDNAIAELFVLKLKSEPTPTQDIIDDNTANQPGSNSNIKSKSVR